VVTKQRFINQIIILITMVTAEKLYEENVKNMKRGASARATLDCIDGDKPFQREEYLRRPNYARAILGTYSEKPSIQERIQTIGRNHLSIGRGLYALVDKTIELTGKILSPIYKEAVRPLASELWGTFKEVVREVWNSGKIAVSTAYKTRQENKKLKSLSQLQREQVIGQKTPEELNSSGEGKCSSLDSVISIYSDPKIFEEDENIAKQTKAPVTESLLRISSDLRSNGETGQSYYPRRKVREGLLNYLKRRALEEIGKRVY